MIDFAPGSQPDPTPPADGPPGTCSLAEGRARQRRIQELDDAIATLSAHLQAATYRLLVLIRLFDGEGGWADQGFKSCARWLSWRTGIGAGAAREKVRVARALGELPVLSEAMRGGELSYSLARAITRVATPENEAELVATARHVSAAQMERLVRAWRRSDRTEAEELAVEAERHAARELSLVAEPDGSWRLRGRLDPEVGATLGRALEAAEEALFRRERAEADDDEAGAPRTPAAARRADALGLVAEAALGEGLAAAEEAPVTGRGDRYQVVVHVPAATLAGAAEKPRDVSAETSGAPASTGARSPGVSAETPRIEDGPGLVAETARRLACDAGRVVMVRGRRGEVLDVGRRTRSVPPALRRALAVRDGGCVFPGCGSRFCDAHHITPWAVGGETTLENLALLCRAHHRLVHEGEWSVERGAGSGGGPEFHFTRPGGGLLPRVPPRPPAPRRTVEALVRRQRALGVDADTATPAWDGLEMDLDLVLQALRPEPLPDRQGAPFPAEAGPGGVSAETAPGDGGDGGPEAEDDAEDGKWLPAGRQRRDG